MISHLLRYRVDINALCSTCQLKFNYYSSRIEAVEKSSVSQFSDGKCKPGVGCGIVGPLFIIRSNEALFFLSHRLTLDYLFWIDSATAGVSFDKVSKDLSGRSEHQQKHAILISYVPLKSHTRRKRKKNQEKVMITYIVVVKPGR